MIPGEGDGQEAAAQETVVSETVVENDAPTPEQVKLEAEAREMGWKPKEAWKGDPEAWRSADEYVKRGKEITPIVYAENRKLRAEIERVKAESADTIARVEKAARTGLKMQREQLVARYEALEEKAAEQGDVKLLRQVKATKTTELAKFDAEVEDKKAETKANGEQPGGTVLSQRDQTAMNEWMAENQWYSAMRGDKVPKNPVLFAAANEEWDRLDEEEPGLPLTEKLAKITKAVQRDFPARFGIKANGHAMVEGANGRGPGGGDAGGGLWAKVPSDVRPVAKNQIEDEGLFHAAVGAKPGTPLSPAQLKSAREMWAKSYFE